ncbi:MAG TPA: hypothetical protein VNQ73_10535 [Ilumatobacter sp.]|nr:hypothetical protein [Ilumatobacter sp.]
MDGTRTTDRAWLVAPCAVALAVLALPAWVVAQEPSAPAVVEADTTVFTVPGGLIGHAEPVPDVPPPPSGLQALRTQATDTPAVTTVPAWSSRPGATHTIYLDFDGHRLDRGAWVAFNLGQPVIAPPFDRDGQPGTFNAAEQQAIRVVWEVVAEDYAPFDVNVTTVDPGISRLVGRSAGGDRWGTRVVVTDGWTGASAGLALVGTFGRGDQAPGGGAWTDLPVWVFADRLYHDPGYIGLAASHETGHALGLHHDGRSPVLHCASPEYYCGHARPAATWAPIMGAGYGRTYTQWSRGDYPGATNHEDDVAIIADVLGLAADDHGDTAATATPIGARTNLVAMAGFGDVDQFEVSVGTGRLQVALGPANTTAGVSNLYARLDVYDARGARVAGAAPVAPPGWSASLDVEVAAGQYRLVVTPVGYRTAEDGFTSYGSAGRYRLAVTGVTTGAPVASPGPTQGGPDAPSAEPSGIVPITPLRVLDTRADSDPSRLEAGGVVRVDLATALGTTAAAAVLNITAVDPADAGYLSAVPCGVDRPTTSSVNYAAHQTVANTTIATLGADGSVCVFSRAATHVVVDVTGWLHPSAAGGLTPVAPQRLADTRATGRLAGGAVLEVDVPDDAPPGISGMAVNLTAANPDAAGHLTAYPCEAPRPATSSVNYLAGEVRANNAIVATPGGRLCVYTHTATDVIVDLSAYVTSGGLRFQPTTPVRIGDTRTEPAGPLGAGHARAFAVPAAPGGVPRAASLNLVAVDHTEAGYLTAYDCGAVPHTSTLNQAAGEVVANGAVVGIGRGGTFCVRTLRGGNVVADLAGWWVD